jgi:hypothetical protein
MPVHTRRSLKGNTTLLWKVEPGTLSGVERPLGPIGAQSPGHGAPIVDGRDRFDGRGQTVDMAP